VHSEIQTLRDEVGEMKGQLQKVASTALPVAGLAGHAPQPADLTGIGCSLYKSSQTFSPRPILASAPIAWCTRRLNLSTPSANPHVVSVAWLKDACPQMACQSDGACTPCVRLRRTEWRYWWPC
jgi:hypothetical protein